MASGYITSDGKDLDERYLAINGKAESAKTADSATNADHATSADSAVSLSAGLQIQTATSDYVTVGDMNLPWTAPVDCFIDYFTYSNDSSNNYMRINGKRIGIFSYGTSEREDLKMYVRKGDVLSGTAYVRLKSLKYIPYKIC